MLNGANYNAKWCFLQNMELFVSTKMVKILMCFEGENNLKSGFLATKIHF